MNNSVRNAGTRIRLSGRLAFVGGLAILGTSALLAGAVASAQDAAKVDPKHYKVEFENDQVRVLRISYGPHDKSVMHSHPAGMVVFLSDAHVKFAMPDGKTQDMKVKAGHVQWTEPTVHDPENLSNKKFEVIQVEFKPKPGATK
jgi:quercetin dioxygenase-like cupin family protein